VHLTPLANLEQLRLNETSVDDASLASLEHMTSLKDLWLNNTNVTDAGINHLLGLARLEFATLMDTQVTEKGAKNLKRAIPACRVQIGKLLGPRSR
jgi:Leucine-rich repeat (LRR) protein